MEDREERQRQKEFLRGYYPDYNPQHHDAYLYRYRLDQDKKATLEYMVRRGIIKEAGK